MKRIGWLAAAAAILVMLGWPKADAATYTYVVKELSQTFTAIQSFGAGLSVPAGQKFYIGESGYSTYLTYDADTGCAQEYQAGNLAWQFCRTYVVAPPCSSTVLKPLGGYCRDAGDGSASSRVLMMTGRGLVDVATGNVVAR